MDWRAEGIVIGMRRHGESAAVVELFTPTQGRHVGLVHGGMGRRKRGHLQLGNSVSAHWRGRLSEHLGTYELEPKLERAGHVMDKALRLNALTAACGLLSAVLPERQAHEVLYEPFVLLLDAIVSADDDDVWPALFVRYELGMLSELGYGLDLSACAVTGAQDDLVYVSPRSGRAVSKEAGADYHDRLLTLPSFLLAKENGSTTRNAIKNATKEDIAAGFALTGYFLERHLLKPHGASLPESRDRLVSRFEVRTSQAAMRL